MQKYLQKLWIYDPVQEVQNVIYITASCYNKFTTSTGREPSYFQFYFIQFYINLVSLCTVFTFATITDH